MSQLRMPDPNRPPMSEASKALRDLRFQKGISPRELARLSSVDAVAIGEIERGIREATKAEAYSIRVSLELLPDFERPTPFICAETPLRQVVIGVLRKGDRYLIGKRSPNGSYPKRWEFPGGKVEGDERLNLSDAMKRELNEELSLGDVVPFACIGRRIFEPPEVERAFEAILFLVRSDFEPIANVHDMLSWATLEQIGGLSDVMPTMAWALDRIGSTQCITAKASGGLSVGYPPLTRLAEDLARENPGVSIDEATDLVLVAAFEPLIRKAPPAALLAAVAALSSDVLLSSGGSEKREKPKKIRDGQRRPAKGEAAKRRRAIKAQKRARKGKRK